MAKEMKVTIINKPSPEVEKKVFQYLRKVLLKSYIRDKK